jgi:uncharacterized membrane protein SpoIIM required for sporulation
MHLPEFVEHKRPRWEELQRLLDRAEFSGLAKLSLDEVRALSRLYRSASADLVYVRAKGGAAEIVGYLNDLVGRAYAVTYPGKRPRLGDVWRFMTHGFPDLFLLEWRAFVAATALFLVGGMYGAFGMAIDPDAAPYLIPGQHQEMDPTKRAAQEAKSDGAQVDEQAAFSAFLMQNNIGVSFLAFAAGATAGIGTALLLFFNGIPLGSLAWWYHSKSLGGWFWAWILPHGIPEVTAICIAGQAGFLIGRGFIAPKGLSRRVAVRKEAKSAVRLILGGILLFILAGLIEGTISQIHPPRLSIAFKISFALAVGAAVYAYLFSALFRRHVEEA